MSRRTLLMVASRAEGIAKLIENRQYELIGYYISCLTFKSNPATLKSISNQLQVIHDAIEDYDVVGIRVVVNELLELAFQEKS